MIFILVVLLVTCSMIELKSPSTVTSSIVSTLVFNCSNATFRDCPSSSRYILLELIVVVPLLILVITLLISSLPPWILALSDTMSSTIRPSPIAPSLIPFSSIRTPTPSWLNKANVKSPLASLPICILTLPLESLNCCRLPLICTPPSSLCISTKDVLSLPAVILLALIVSIIAFLMNASATVTLSAVKINDWMLSLVKCPLIKVSISATLAFKLSISALVALKFSISAFITVIP